MTGKKHLGVQVAILLLLCAVFGVIKPQASYALRVDHQYDSTKISHAVGLGYAYGYATKTDVSGNVYVAGVFEYTVDFDPGAGTDNHTSNGNSDAFLTKYNADGSYGWTRTWGSTGSDYALSVATDSTGAVYVGGSFNGTVDLNATSGTDTVASNGAHDAFITKYASDGSYSFSRTWGDLGDVGVYALAVDSSDALYAAGIFQDSPDFDPSGSVDTHASNGLDDGFLAKYASNGTYDWTKTWGGVSAEYIDGLVVSGAQVYVAGYYQTTVDFDPSASTDNHTSNGGNDAFLSEFTTSGNFTWTKTWGGTGDDTAFYVAADSTGDLYVSGQYQTTVDFDPSASTDNHTSYGGNDAYLLKLDTTGSMVWAKTWGGPATDYTWPIIIDSSDTIFAVGYTESSDIDFDPSTGTFNVNNAGEREIFAAQYNASGTFMGAGSFGGNSYEEVYAGTIDSNDNLYLTGITDSTSINFNPTGNADIQTPSGSGDVFLYKLKGIVYQNITALPSGLKVVEPTSGQEATNPNMGVHHDSAVSVLLSTSSNVPISGIVVDFTSDHSWGGVVADSDPVNYKAFISGLGSASGVTGTHSLYIPKRAGDNATYICPHATTLSQVSPTCLDKQMHIQGDADTSVVTINGSDYWLVMGLTGTGGASVVLGDATVKVPNTGLSPQAVAYQFTFVLVGLSALAYSLSKKLIHS